MKLLCQHKDHFQTKDQTRSVCDAHHGIMGSQIFSSFVGFQLFNKNIKYQLTFCSALNNLVWPHQTFGTIWRHFDLYNWRGAVGGQLKEDKGTAGRLQSTGLWHTAEVPQTPDGISLGPSA